jgi:hypothetical protein
MGQAGSAQEKYKRKEEKRKKKKEEKATSGLNRLG